MSRTIVRHATLAALAAALIIPAATASAAAVHDLRVGEHPGSTRVVLDVSEPSDMTIEVSADGRTITVDLPAIEWRAGDFAQRHAKGLLSGYRYTPAAAGGRLSLAMSESVKIRAPFFVGPEGKQGHRVVIDIAPDPIAATAPAMQRVAPQPLNQPIAQSSLAAERMEPPVDVAMAPRQVASTRSTEAEKTQSYSSGQAVVLSPGNAAQPVETAQARPQPAPQAPMPSGPLGGLMYIKLGVGLGMLEEASASGTADNATLETDLGWAVLGSLGLDLKNNFRVEGETFYTSNGAKSATGTMNGAAINSGDVSGDVSTLAFMANLTYDFVNAYAITPYIFGGAGIARVSVDGVGSGTNQGWDDSDWVFGLQAGLGVALDVSDRFTFDLNYRYFETQEPELANANGVPFNYENAMHMILFGARYKF